MAEILVVDDEIGIRELLSEILGDEGHSVHVAESASEARRVREAARPDLVLLDIWMPDTDGVTLLKEWAANGRLTMPVIMMSGHATIDTAVEATRIGALDFLEKPIALQKLLKAVEQGLHRAKSQPPLRVVQPNAYPRPGGADAHSHISVAQPVAGSATVMAAAAAIPGGSAGAAVVPAQTASIGLAQLPLDLPLREARDAFERAYFEHHLSREHGSMTRVAERTGLERTHLYRKLKQLGIDLAKGQYRKTGGH
ncbi:MAG: response regulator [Burkholderiales bacterium]|nr:MAG: response regulator [Burkholderiales bacterium]